MSFSTEVKEELAALRTEKSCCMLTELNALTQSCASMTLHGRGQVSIAYTTENIAVAKRVFLLLKRRLEISVAPRFSKLPRFGGRRVCTLRLTPADTRKLMYALHMLHEDDGGEVFHGIPRRAQTRKCCQQAFLRGAFLGGGSITQPERDYHVEFVCGNEKRAAAIVQILQKNGLSSGLAERRGTSVVYLKRGQEISTLLRLMGASRAMMRFENVLIRRSLHESVLRATTCDANNMARHLAAAQRQAEAIRFLKEKSAFEALSPSLQSLARLRLLRPDATLEQIGELLDPPLGRSGVNHRFRQIMEKARALGFSPEE